MAASETLDDLKAVLERYAEALGRAGIRPERIYLYGSYAFGTQNPWSDMDVAVVSPDFSGHAIEDQLRLFRVAWTVDTRIEPHAHRPENFNEENPWAAEVIETGVRVL